MAPGLQPCSFNSVDAVVTALASLRMVFLCVLLSVVWFVVRDVANALGYLDTAKDRFHLDSIWTYWFARLEIIKMDIEVLERNRQKNIALVEKWRLDYCELHENRLLFRLWLRMVEIPNWLRLATRSAKTHRAFLHGLVLANSSRGTNLNQYRR
jgi:hypothetical protein